MQVSIKNILFYVIDSQSRTLIRHLLFNVLRRYEEMNLDRANLEIELKKIRTRYNYHHSVRGNALKSEEGKLEGVNFLNNTITERR